MDKGFCQSPAYRSKLTDKLQFTSCRDKLRRLWRPAVATHPPIAEHQLRRVPMGHVTIRNPLQAAKQRSCGTCIISLFLGSTKRDRLSSSTLYEMLNLQLILNQLAVQGCVATARRHSLLCLFLTWRTIPNSQLLIPNS